MMVWTAVSTVTTVTSLDTPVYFLISLGAK